MFWKSLSTNEIAQKTTCAARVQSRSFAGARFIVDSIT